VDKKTIILVEDDLELAALTQERLEKEGFHVLHEENGERARDLILDTKPDLVVLDLMLPGIDGFDVCRQVRPAYAGPILILTARDDDLDEILGLELGADDFVTKPIKPRLLLARIRALLRRSSRKETPTKQEKLQIGELVVDASRREVSIVGAPVELTTTEFDLLHYLTSRAGEVVSRQQIYQAMFQYDYDGLDRSIDVYISRLRQKLGDNPGAPHYIKTVRGVGYLMAGEKT
jgi:two-component system response regulator RstA